LKKVPKFAAVTLCFPAVLQNALPRGAALLYDAVRARRRLRAKPRFTVMPQKGVLMSADRSHVVDIIKANEAEVLADWLADLKASGWGNDGRVSEAEVQSRAREMLKLLPAAVRGGTTDLNAADAAPLRDFLATLSRALAEKGFTSDQTATFVFSLKKPVFARVRKTFATDAAQLADATWSANELLDKLGLFTVLTYQKSREDIIRRQQEEMLELSTPVVKLWEGVLALPMIGTLDSARTQVVMESLLQRIVETGSETAIIDITGVPTVDTLVAQHLLKTVTAIRLMGADCIISGIRPQIAQTIVHLGIDLEGITTRATLADALTLALKRSGFVVSKAKA
jgi:rsbT co-antagonist protein RsbR